ncbi:anhydro-N-acetylmuramic acid kinase [Anaerocolumna sp. MB42-C2]|uniref:anhydro-N-acetylmuramic acid kinase n=1 Tax=Anaerocolumna sp. MB42-C2 TaxID=3070997 RepID=UPI0027E0828F|nr:anhydro-N-acetylmuramic acid kinase [Anaerocolumna sp. MB42-C2]WMJ86945.1 anhydro-N-acetylmuramic acid kinase [Anaerocolumna sp. MB42-C2]
MIDRIANKEVRRIIGLMSGTSVDGIDAALVEITGNPYEGTAADGNSADGRVKLLAFENKPFPEKIRNQIFELFQAGNATVDKVGYMNFLLGELYAKSACSVAGKAGLSIKEIDCIGSHGQTIYHHPEPITKDGYLIGYTVQIGEGAVIAQRTKVPCVSDFRVADMAAGGQGAPLVPFTEYVLYRKKEETILLQNIGGIGNITVLPKNCKLNEVYAFDTGPGNMIMDGMITRFTGGVKTMDENGKIAAAGKVDTVLLDELKRHPYFKEKPPKSTGREMFGEEFIKNVYEKVKIRGISLQDTMATTAEFTAWSIVKAYQKFIMPLHKADKLYIGGGGSYNTTLVDKIRKPMDKLGVSVLIQEDIGFNSDAKEAVAFALLADCTIAGRYNSIPSVTGAAGPVIMGKISLCKDN